jgi:hypothetical protein
MNLHLSKFLVLCVGIASLMPSNSRAAAIFNAELAQRKNTVNQKAPQFVDYKDKNDVARYLTSTTFRFSGRQKKTVLGERALKLNMEDALKHLQKHRAEKTPGENAQAEMTVMDAYNFLMQSFNPNVQNTATADELLVQLIVENNEADAAEDLAEPEPTQAEASAAPQVVADSNQQYFSPEEEEIPDPTNWNDTVSEDEQQEKQSTEHGKQARRRREDFSATEESELEEAAALALAYANVPTAEQQAEPNQVVQKVAPEAPSQGSFRYMLGQLALTGMAIGSGPAAGVGYFVGALTGNESLQNASAATWKDTLSPDWMKKPKDQKRE